jgi:hypothetical protein
MSRIVCQFSCGAASAVATKLALAQYGATHDVQIINAFLAEEHPDNLRFKAECVAWFGQQIITLRDFKDDASVVRVFRRKQYMMGPWARRARARSSASRWTAGSSQAM